jgi:peptide subunit release factor 1 (eRF1)
MKKHSRRKTKKYEKGYAYVGEPLYTKEDFLYYFENRLQHIIRDEVDAHFKQSFYNLPF